MEPVIFESMDRRAHAAFIRSVGNGALKGRWRQPAHAARTIYIERSERIAAANAQGIASGGNFHPAGIANSHGRKARQKGAAKRAGCRKEDAAYGIHGTSEYARDSTPCRCLRGWNVERQ
jgi:hypothetical protein